MAELKPIRTNRISPCTMTNQTPDPNCFPEPLPFAGPTGFQQVLMVALSALAIVLVILFFLGIASLAQGDSRFLPFVMIAGASSNVCFGIARRLM